MEAEKMDFGTILVSLKYRNTNPKNLEVGGVSFSNLSFKRQMVLFNGKVPLIKIKYQTIYRIDHTFALWISWILPMFGIFYTKIFTNSILKMGNV